jgi:hypothetical protein
MKSLYKTGVWGRVGGGRKHINLYDNRKRNIQFSSCYQLIHTVLYTQKPPFLSTECLYTVQKIVLYVLTVL